MSTKTQTDQKSSNALQFDPQSLSTYKSLTGSGSNVLSQYMNNPFGNALYQLGLGQSQKGVAAGGNNAMQAMLSQMKTSGLSGNAGNAFQAAQKGKIGRSTSASMANANTSNIQAALQRQMQATGMGMSFNPLMTGSSGTSSSTQTTGGLGTWLPQLLGSAAGMAMGGLTGGLMGGGGGPPSTSSLPSSSGFGLGNSFPSQFAGFNQGLPPKG